MDNLPDLKTLVEEMIMSNGMQWKPISEFNPNNYKIGTLFLLFNSRLFRGRVYEIVGCFDEAKSIELYHYTHFMKLEQPEGEQP